MIRLKMSRGTSFVELLVSVGLSLFIFSAVLSVLSVGYRGMRISQEKTAAQEANRQALDQVASVVRGAGQVTVQSQGSLLLTPAGSTTQLILNQVDDLLGFYQYVPPTGGNSAKQSEKSREGDGKSSSKMGVVTGGSGSTGSIYTYTNTYSGAPAVTTAAAGGSQSSAMVVPAGYLVESVQFSMVPAGGLVLNPVQIEMVAGSGQSRVMLRTATSPRPFRALVAGGRGGGGGGGGCAACAGGSVGDGSAGILTRGGGTIMNVGSTIQDSAGNTLTVTSYDSITGNFTGTSSSGSFSGTSYTSSTGTVFYSGVDPTTGNAFSGAYNPPSGTVIGSYGDPTGSYSSSLTSYDSTTGAFALSGGISGTYNSATGAFTISGTSISGYYDGATGAIVATDASGTVYTATYDSATGSITGTFTGSDPYSLTPVILDLAGTGVPDVANGDWLPHPSRFDRHRAKIFDMTGEGFTIVTEWLGPNSGLLCTLDRNGTVSSVEQLFGTTGGYVDGYAKLAARFDRDRNGIVQGDELDGLYVWHDRNRNAKVEPQELNTVRQWGITRIWTTHEKYRSAYERGGKIYHSWDWWASAFVIRKEDRNELLKGVDVRELFIKLRQLTRR